MSQDRQSSIRVQAPGLPETGDTATLIFDSDRILQAICFHVLDEGHGSRVDAVSIRVTRLRLQKQNAHAAITRVQWTAMSNRERLEWLLARSKTSVIQTGHTIVLSPD